MTRKFDFFCIFFCISKKIDRYLFLSAMVDVEGVKTTLKVDGTKHILLNISEIIEDTLTMYTVLEKSLLFKQNYNIKRTTFFVNFK